MDTDELFEAFGGAPSQFAAAARGVPAPTPSPPPPSSSSSATTTTSPTEASSSSSSPSSSKRPHANSPAPANQDVAEASSADSAAQKRAKKAPAKVYPFTLDDFQRQAIDYLEANESVLVSAHTSAGKTAVAEYAIAIALRDKQRVVYTSPIKALSNQKFRDLSAEFNDVGLMTGDVTINPNASCLVMTTEILRSMLYRGSEILREVAWAIFDEVHAMNDRERGVVWEESIVLLPHKVRYVFLSATIPNGTEFCRWVSKLHRQPCHMVFTNYRPTPLQHYMFPGGGEGLFLVVDEKGRFLQDKFEAAMAAIGGLAGSGKDSGMLREQVLEGTGGRNRAAAKARAARRGGKQQDLFRIVKMIMERHYDPVIVFSFSKRDCETFAVAIAKTDMTNDDEKKLIKQVFENAIDSLTEDDKALPQVTSLLPLLKRGIGIHHGGLLPILKEVVEILFGEGLIKCLFATETFAMGVNMPAKTVVFTSNTKFDGTEMRLVGPGEYIQMSGRAGRRGLDDRGIVIAMVEEQMDASQAREMMSGTADPLKSTFRLGYNMVLNLLRVEDADPEFMVRNSFYMFQRESAVPALQQQADELRAQAEAITIAPEKVPVIAEYHHIVSEIRKVRAELRTLTTEPAVCLRFLQYGRLVKIVDPVSNRDLGWAIVLATLVSAVDGDGDGNGDDGSVDGAGQKLAPGKDSTTHEKKKKKKKQKKNTNKNAGPAVSTGAGTSGSPGSADAVSLRILLECDAKAPSGVFRAVEGDGGEREMRVRTVPLRCVDGISVVVMNLPSVGELETAAGRKMALSALQEVRSRFPAGITLCDPSKDLGVTSPALDKLLAAGDTLREQLANSAAQKLPPTERSALYETFLRKDDLSARVRALQQEILSVQDVPMKDTLKHMKVVLRRLGFVDAENVVQLKGRVACEVTTADELLCTELLLTGTFNDLAPEACAALCSCLVFVEKGEDGIEVRPELAPPLRALRAVARRIGEIQRDALIPIDVDEYVDSFRSDIMEAVFLWCRGVRFAEVCEVCEVFEGTLIRCVRRLVELLRQLCSASKVIGDESLYRKFAKAIANMQRDIIFAASLYL